MLPTLCLCMLFVFALSSAPPASVEIDIENTIRVGKYFTEGVDLVSGLTWWTSNSKVANIAITRKEMLPLGNAYGIYSLQGRTKDVKDSQELSYAVRTLMEKFVTIAQRMQELFEVNKIDFLEKWMIDNSAELQNFRVPFCALFDDGEPALKTYVLPWWKMDGTKSGYEIPFHGGLRNVRFDESGVWDNAEPKPELLFTYSPKITMSYTLERIEGITKNEAVMTYLIKNIDPGFIWNQMNNPNLAKFIPTKQKDGARQYLFFLAYYVSAMVKKAEELKTCELLDPVEGLNLIFRTNLQQFHNFVDGLEPKQNKLPTGAKLFNLVLALAFGCTGPDCTGKWPLRDCIQGRFSIGGARGKSLSLQDIIFNIHVQDTFALVHPDLALPLPMLPFDGKDTVPIQFRSLSNICGKTVTAKVVPSLVGRYYDFLSSLQITPLRSAKMDVVSPCNTNVFYPKAGLVDVKLLQKKTRPEDDPCPPPRPLPPQPRPLPPQPRPPRLRSQPDGNVPSMASYVAPAAVLAGGAFVGAALVVVSGIVYMYVVNKRQGPSGNVYHQLQLA